MLVGDKQSEKKLNGLGGTGLRGLMETVPIECLAQGLAHSRANEQI